MELIKFLFIIYVILPTVTLAIIYSLTKYYGHSKLTIPFLSHTIDYAPESCIGALGLNLTLMISFFFLLLKYKHNFLMILTKQTTVYVDEKGFSSYFKLNKACLFVGIISVFAALGVISFQAHNSYIAHMVFSMLFFFAGISHMTLSISLDWKFSIQHKGVILLRLFLTLFNLLVLGGFFFPFFFFPSSIKTLLLSNIAAGCEFVITLVYFCFIASYYFEFRSLELNFEVHDKSVAMRGSSNSENSLFLPKTF